MNRRATGLVLCTFVVISGCSDNFTHIFENEEEETDDDIDQEPHKNSFRSSPGMYNEKIIIGTSM